MLEDVLEMSLCTSRSESSMIWALAQVKTVSIKPQNLEQYSPVVCVLLLAC